MYWENWELAILEGKVKKGRSDPKRERKYACPECGKMFKHSEHVKIHQMEHLGQFSNFFSPIINYKKIFSDGIENQKPFKCDMCDMRFRRESERKFHKKVKHSGELTGIGNDLSYLHCVWCHSYLNDETLRGLKRFILHSATLIHILHGSYLYVASFQRHCSYTTIRNLLWRE